MNSLHISGEFNESRIISHKCTGKVEYSIHTDHRLSMHYIESYNKFRQEKHSPLLNHTQSCAIPPHLSKIIFSSI